MDLVVNGVRSRVDTDPERPLLWVLRNELDLTGAKYGCGEGQCGACTVLIEGVAHRSCLTPVGSVSGKEITTIEGLSADGSLHPLQAAFIEHDGFQCGYCTPGQICSAIGMIQEFRSGLPSAVTADVAAETIEFSDEELNERMSGNLCRCGAYVGIRAAIREAFGSEVSR